jgi:excisionase family DNA binding protein
MFFVYFVCVYDAKRKPCEMNNLEEIKRPTKQEQKTAMESYHAICAMLTQLNSSTVEIEIEETKEKIKIPLHALKLLAKILEATSKGNPISIISIATELTTQAAAEFLGCSRPHLVKLLEEGEIPFTKVGKHRRVKFEDCVGYKKRKREEREALLVEIMKGDEEIGLYDSQR